MYLIKMELLQKMITNMDHHIFYSCITGDIFSQNLHNERLDKFHN